MNIIVSLHLLAAGVLSLSCHAIEIERRSLLRGGLLGFFAPRAASLPSAKLVTALAESEATGLKLGLLAAKTSVSLIAGPMYSGHFSSNGSDFRQFLIEREASSLNDESLIQRALDVQRAAQSLARSESFEWHERMRVQGAMFDLSSHLKLPAPLIMGQAEQWKAHVADQLLRTQRELASEFGASLVDIVQASEFIWRPQILIEHAAAGTLATGPTHLYTDAFAEQLLNRMATFAPWLVINLRSSFSPPEIQEVLARILGICRYEPWSIRTSYVLGSLTQPGLPYRTLDEIGQQLVQALRQLRELKLQIESLTLARRRQQILDAILEFERVLRDELDRAPEIEAEFQAKFRRPARQTLTTAAWARRLMGLLPTAGLNPWPSLLAVIENEDAPASIATKPCADLLALPASTAMPMDLTPDLREKSVTSLSEEPTSR